MAQKLAPTGHVPVWIIVVSVMALAVGFAVVAVLGVADALPRDVLGALRVVEPRVEEGPLIHIDSPPTGVARGIQLGLLALLLGGVPTAILATAMAPRRRTRPRPWSGGWSNVFLAGFVFQLSSLLFTGLVLAVVLFAAAYDSAVHAQEVVALGGPLLLSIVFSIWGLRCWRALQHQVREGPATITPYQRAG